MNGSVIFFKEYEIYKPDINKMDKEIFTNVVENCNDRYFLSFYCDYVCDIEIKDNKNGKIVIGKIRGDKVVDVGNKLTSDFRKPIFTREKNFEFIQCNKVVI